MTTEGALLYVLLLTLFAALVLVAAAVFSLAWWVM